MARFQIDAFGANARGFLFAWKSCVCMLEAPSGRAAIDAFVRDQTTAGLVGLFDDEFGALVAYDEDGRWVADRELNVDEAGH